MILTLFAAGQQACFMLQGSSFQEINWFRPEFGSWFVNDLVLQGMSVILNRQDLQPVIFAQSIQSLIQRDKQLLT